MKLGRTLTVILCLLLALSPSKGQQQGGDSLTVVSLANNKKYTVTVSRDRMEKTPAWNDGEDVPYPVRKAKASAIQELSKLLPDATDYDLDSIALEKTESRWYYRVQFFKLRGASEGVITPFVVVVLLDGSVIEPVVGPIN